MAYAPTTMAQARGNFATAKVKLQGNLAPSGVKTSADGPPLLFKALEVEQQEY
jgi:hypothetical protein